MTASASAIPRDRGGAGRWAVAIGIGIGLVALTLFSWASVARPEAGLGAVTLLLWSNVIVMIVALVVEIRRRPYSLHLMHLLALFLFLGISALLQFATGKFAVAGPVENMHGELLSASLAVSLWLAGYITTYELHRRFSRGVSRAPIGRFFDRHVSGNRVLWLHLAAIATLGYLGAIGLLGLSTRGAAEEALIDYANETAAGSGLALAFKLLNQYLLRGFPLVVMVAGFLEFPRTRGTRRLVLGVLLAMLVVGNLLANNPLAASRMWLVTALFGGIAPTILRRFRTGWLLLAITLAGLTLLPALHQSRAAFTFSEWIYWAKLASPVRYLSASADGDNLGMISLAVRWVERHGHTLGKQTLGAIAFWFPRRWWPTKPIGTGAMVTGDLGYGFTGWSMPIVAEGYVDWSYGGVVFLALLFGWVLSRGDRTYWEGRPAGGPQSPRVIEVLYPLWLGCVLFFTRGDLMAASSHTSPFVLWAIALGAGRARGSARSR